MNQNTKQILKGLGIGLGILGILALLFKKANSKKPKKILIVGDSQSAIVDSSGNKISFTYPNILKKILEPQGYKIDVLAIGGKTTDWMKSNLPNQLTKNKYDRVYIYGGGNDTSNSSIKLDTTLNNIQKMVDMSLQSGADDVIVNLGWKIQGDFGNYKIMPLTPYLSKKEDWIPYVEKRKELQRLIPQRIKNAKFIQPYDLKSLTKDGIHPTAQGHKIVADVFLKSITND
jgi:lysophospholipase L1-like esterase